MTINHDKFHLGPHNPIVEHVFVALFRKSSRVHDKGAKRVHRPHRRCGPRTLLPEPLFFFNFRAAQSSMCSPRLIVMVLYFYKNSTKHGASLHINFQRSILQSRTWVQVCSSYFQRGYFQRDNLHRRYVETCFCSFVPEALPCAS